MWGCGAAPRQATNSICKGVPSIRLSYTRLSQVTFPDARRGGGQVTLKLIYLIVAHTLRMRTESAVGRSWPSSFAYIFEFAFEYVSSRRTVVRERDISFR